MVTNLLQDDRKSKYIMKFMQINVARSKLGSDFYNVSVLSDQESEANSHPISVVFKRHDPPASTRPLRCTQNYQEGNPIRQH